MPQEREERREMLSLQSRTDPNRPPPASSSVLLSTVLSADASLTDVLSAEASITDADNAATDADVSVDADASVAEERAAVASRGSQRPRDQKETVSRDASARPIISTAVVPAIGMRQGSCCGTCPYTACPPAMFRPAASPLSHRWSAPEKARRPNTGWNEDTPRPAAYTPERRESSESAITCPAGETSIPEARDPRAAARESAPLRASDASSNTMADSWRRTSRESYVRLRNTSTGAASLAAALVFGRRYCSRENGRTSTPCPLSSHIKCCPSIFGTCPASTVASWHTSVTLTPWEAS
mmetsp:Transcript_46245/g.105380  ORF Transcript_46245/g.105380 Transcript_46245/m.105380 type:complete len:298 (+) Transcript_46245:522-1415(+)